MIEKLLAEVTAINKKYALLYQKTGAYFNIFDITGISSDEVAICKMLCELININGSHYQDDAYLRLFVNDVLKLNFTELDFLTARVHREHNVDRRRIDLFIISLNYMIPIEVKIFAGDQDGQCFDYSKTKQKSDLYYLTLDGRLPNVNSADGLIPEIEDGEIIGYEGVKLLSFKHDIINWLNKCLALHETIKISPIREILLQFRDILYKLTEQTEDEVKMDISNLLISSPDNMKNALDIANALPEAKTKIMLNLFRELNHLFKNGNRVINDYDEEIFKQYYFSHKRLYPYLSVEILRLSDNLSLSIFIESAWDLCFGFSFSQIDKNGKVSEYIETERIKKEQPEIYTDCTKIIYEVMRGKGKESPTAIFWEYILDDKGRQLDFKNFSPSCVELTLNYAELAKSIFIMLDGYIKAVSKKLNGI